MSRFHQTTWLPDGLDDFFLLFVLSVRVSFFLWEGRRSTDLHMWQFPLSIQGELEQNDEVNQ